MGVCLLANAAAAADKRIIGYLAEWGDWKAADIPADRLTHINYAFALIKDGRISFDNPVAATQQSFPDDPSAGAPFLGHFRQLQRLKQTHPRLQTLISIGGWGGSSEFSDIALTADSRDKFAASCAKFGAKYGFDGIDIDWEYPCGGGLDPAKGRPQDTQNFTLLLQSLRTELDRQGKADGKHYLLTIAAPAAPSKYTLLELDRVARIVDWINLMTYDFSGAWSPLTSFNSPLFASDPSAAEPELSIDAAVKGYLTAGVPPEKLVVGVPFYGHAWTGVKNINNGLSQSHDDKAAQPDGGGEFTYRTLSDHYIGKNGQRFWHDVAKVPWLYDSKTGLMVSYDDPESLKLKAEYVRDKHLGGVMIWELSQDDKQSSLLNALNAGLRKN